MDALGQVVGHLGLDLTRNFTVQPLTATYGLTWTTFTSLTTCMDCHCVLEKQPREADHLMVVNVKFNSLLLCL